MCASEKSLISDTVTIMFSKIVIEEQENMFDFYSSGKPIQVFFLDIKTNKSSVPVYPPRDAIAYLVPNLRTGWA